MPHFVSFREASTTSFHKLVFTVVFLFLLINDSFARIHHLTIEDDLRQQFRITSFGYLRYATMRVNFSDFSFEPQEQDSVLGFSLIKTQNDARQRNAKDKEFCILEEPLDTVSSSWLGEGIGLMRIKLDLKNNKAIFDCNAEMNNFRIIKGYNNFLTRRKRAPENLESKDKLGSNSVNEVFKALNQPKGNLSDNNPNPKVNPGPALPDKAKEKVSEKNEDNVKSNANPPLNSIEDNNDPEKLPDEAKDDNQPVPNLSDESEVKDLSQGSCNNFEIDLIQTPHPSGLKTYSFSFHSVITEEPMVGLYSLYFHNCPNYNHHSKLHDLTRVNFTMLIEEKNPDTYLSAGEIVLPQLYFILSLVFCILGVIWIQVLRGRRDDVFKIHYLMGTLVFIKAIALFFHSVNYHFIGIDGYQDETWAILYYSTHFLKGALLFTTIALIGTGWAFIKHILSDKDKRMFMVVIPLQVLANVAEIIAEESEEGEQMHNIWRTIFILVDLICCGAILFPIIWSIRHLQEASHTDGKAAINLVKLKLFRRFYVMIVCYIYFTRIIVYILRLMVQFQYEWLDVFFQNTVTLLFFIFTGYQFQPAHSNPYFQLSNKDLEMEEILFDVTPNIYVATNTKKRTREKATGDKVKNDRQALIIDKDDEIIDFE